MHFWWLLMPWNHAFFFSATLQIICYSLYQMRATQWQRKVMNNQPYFHSLPLHASLMALCCSSGKSLSICYQKCLGPKLFGQFLHPILKYIADWESSQSFSFLKFQRFKFTKGTSQGFPNIWQTTPNGHYKCPHYKCPQNFVDTWLSSFHKVGSTPLYMMVFLCCSIAISFHCN